MTRLACLRASLFAGTLLAVVVARPAMASDPVAAYVAASRVDTTPNDADATSVVIHGAFIFLQADGGYTAPQCGYMYFVCAAGSETMCRMQWKDVRTISTLASQCAGFGALRVVATATLRAEGTPLGSPDTWDLGIGVTSGISVGGQCQPAKMLACPLPSGSGGAGGTGGGGTGGGGTGAGGTTGTGGTGETTGTGGTGGNVGTTGTGGMITGVAGSDGAGTGGSPQVLASRSACGIAGAVSAPAGWGATAFSVVTLLAAAALRRRRRR